MEARKVNLVHGPYVIAFEPHQSLVATGSGSRCRRRSVSGRAAEAGFERSVGEVVPDPGRAGSGGDPCRNDVGTQGGRRGKNVEVSLPRGNRSAGPCLRSRSPLTARALARLFSTGTIRATSRAAPQQTRITSPNTHGCHPRDQRRAPSVILC